MPHGFCVFELAENIFQQETMLSYKGTRMHIESECKNGVFFGKRTVTKKWQTVDQDPSLDGKWYEKEKYNILGDSINEVDSKDAYFINGKANTALIPRLLNLD